MDYISIKNLEKYHPKYKDGRRSIWIRWDIGAMRDYKISRLPDDTKWLFVALVCLAFENNNQIPNDEKWIKQQIGSTNNHISSRITMLQTLELIVISCNGDLKSPSPTYVRNERNDTEVTEYAAIAESIYNHYSKTIKPGTKQEAINGVVGILKTGVSKDDLIGRVDAYRDQLTHANTEKQFYLQAASFFGKKARWRDYEPKKEVKYKDADPNCRVCKGNGKYLIEATQEIKICSCRVMESLNPQN